MSAGLILLAIGLPLTLALTMLAISPDGLSPALPLAAGGPPILLGYVACHFASARLAKAKAVENGEDASCRTQDFGAKHAS